MDQCTVTGQHDYERLAYAVGGIWWQARRPSGKGPACNLSENARFNGCVLWCVPIGNPAARAAPPRRRLPAVCPPPGRAL